jgi:membrane-associated protein
MEAVSWFIHLDKHLNELIQAYGVFTYVILFLIIFCETGLVVTPILPGDSLLFAVGVFTSYGSLNLPVILVLLTTAAILGDTVNYTVGHYLSGRLVGGRFSWLIKQKHLDQTNAFFEKYGAETIIIARFVPIVRTFAPFVAGAGSMSYGKFITYNVVGALIWVNVLTLGGYFFAEVPIVKNNFGLVTIGIIVVSLLPAVFHVVKAMIDNKKANAEGQ